MHSAEFRSCVCPRSAHASHSFPRCVAETFVDANDAGSAAPHDVEEAGFAAPPGCKVVGEAGFAALFWDDFVDGVYFGVKFVRGADFEVLLASDGAGFAALLGANDRRPCFPNVGTKKATATSIGQVERST